MLKRPYRNETARKLNERRAEARREGIKKYSREREARAAEAAQRRAGEKDDSVHPPEGLVRELNDEGV